LRSGIEYGFLEKIHISKSHIQIYEPNRPIKPGFFQHRKDQFVENEGNKREQNHFKPVPGRQNKAGTIVADKL
jgi:hypothetical protein